MRVQTSRTINKSFRLHERCQTDRDLYRQKYETLRSSELIMKRFAMVDEQWDTQEGSDT
jgi:hypothetical protein